MKNKTNIIIISILVIYSIYQSYEIKMLDKNIIKLNNDLIVIETKVGNYDSSNITNRVNQIDDKLNKIASSLKYLSESNNSVQGAIWGANGLKNR